MGITVEVIADPDSNINVDLPVRILVKNTGRSTAAGVIVCYPVPTGIDFVASQPAPSQTLGPLQVWQLEPLAPGAEKSLRLTVRARQVGPIDHAPTVTIRGGTKTRTMVRQPRLKVEMAASETRVQRGQSIKFDITVTNTGDGPARDVVLEASLSNGLTHASKGSVLKQALRDAFESGSLQPGDSRLIELPVDAAQGGEQTCTVVATSPDVAIGQDPGANEARAVAKLMVVEPMLRLQLTGSRERYPDTIARYVISVDNPGTAPARQVQVAAQVPTGGTPYEIPADARFDEERRTLYWNIGEIEPGKPVELTFHVRMGGIGNYPVSAYTRAAGGLKDEKSCTTQVVGLAQVEFDLLARRRVLDTGEETLYEIRLENTGSIDASNVLVKAQLTEQLVVVETGGTNAPATAGSPNAPRDALFPPIERIPPGGKLTLTVRVKAVAEGVGACKVSVAHDNVPPLEHTESIRITRPVE
jgi:uncharacterized repeat protein (TIGR01451 family)